jgi:hypothetical protein
LFVTVFVVDADTAVEAKAFPVTAGNVITALPAMAGAASVVAPLVSPVILIEPINKLLLVKNVD